MRRMITIAMSVLLIFLSISCRPAQETASLRINIDRGKRTISPSAGQLNIQTFVVRPIGPDGSAGTIKTVYTDSTTIEGLKLGEWTIKVEGKNNEGTVIATGENKIMLSPSNNTVEVTLSELFGTGNLDLSFRWDSNRITDTSMTASLLPQDKSESAIDISSKLIRDSDYTYSLFITDLNSGSYILSGTLYSGGEKIGGFTEAIRISNGATTKGTVSFGLDKIINADIGFSNITSVPIECRIEGITDLIPSGRSINASVRIITGNVKESELRTEWYLDGVKMGTGRTFSFTPEPGDHRLDAVVSTEHSGSVGSASTAFTAATLKRGLPYRLMTYKSDDRLRLGGRTLIRIVPDQNPDKINNLIIVTDNRQYLQTLLMNETSFSVAQMQKITDSSWGYTEELKDIVFSGNPSSGTLKATLLFDGPAIAMHQYTVNGAVLSNRKIASQSSLSMTGNRILNHFGYGSYHRDTDLVISGAYNPDGYNFGYVLISPSAGDASGDWSKFIMRSSSSMANATFESVRFGGENILNETNGRNHSILAYGNGFFVFRSRRKDNGTIGLNLSGVPDAGGKISGAAAIGDDYFAVLVKPTANTSEIQIYRWTASSYEIEKVSTYSDPGARYKLLKYCQDSGFLYTINESSKQLIVMAFSDSGTYPSFIQTGCIALPDTDYDSMEISDDGSMIVLYSKEETDRFTVLNVRTVD